MGHRREAGRDRHAPGAVKLCPHRLIAVVSRLTQVRVVHHQAVRAVLDVEPARRAHVERHHQVVGVPAQGGGRRGAAPGAPVHGPAHVVQRGHLHHHVHDAGRGGERGQRERVVPRVAAQEAHPQRRPAGRLAEQLRRHPHRVAQPEAEHVGVEAQGRLLLRRGQHHVAQAHRPGDEPVPVRADRGPRLQRRAAERLQRVARRVLEAEQRADPALGQLGGGARLDRDAGRVERPAQLTQRALVRHLPARGEQPVLLPWHDDQPGREFIHPQVQRLLLPARGLRPARAFLCRTPARRSMSVASMRR